MQEENKQTEQIQDSQMKNEDDPNLERNDLVKISVTEKKTLQLLEHREFFELKMKEYKDKLVDVVVSEKDAELKTIEGRDIKVCIRARPLLQHEIDQKYFETVHSQNPKFHFFEAKLNVRQLPVFQSESNLVDYAFGPSDDNEYVYNSTIHPLIDASLQGGSSFLFAYGQTGAGKTYTVDGILDRVSNDLFRRQKGKQLKEDGTSNISITANFFQLIGDNPTDLANDLQSFKIGEDKMGRLIFLGLTEIEITSPEQFVELKNQAAALRKTSKTYKNDTSSRSHSICRFKIQNLGYRSMEPGELIVIDLAGSESLSDSQFHDKQLQKEMILINKSLQNLKQCIRNRAMQALNPTKAYHIPYRNSKLTHIVKDSLELKSNRLCKTVIIANISPSVGDLVQTKNTLRFITPIKIGAKEKVKAVIKTNDEKNPATWNNEFLKEWVTTYSRGEVNTEMFCPFETGKQILSIPQSEFLDRLYDQKIGEELAQKMYDLMWLLLIDARARFFKEEREKTMTEEQIQKAAINKINMEKLAKNSEQTDNADYAQKAKINIQLVVSHENNEKLYNKEFSIMTKISEMKQFCQATFETKIEHQEIRMKNIKTANMVAMLDDEKTLDEYGVQAILDSGDFVLQCRDTSSGDKNDAEKKVGEGDQGNQQ